jgi:hypothetical protein
MMAIPYASLCPIEPDHAAIQSERIKLIVFGDTQFSERWLHMRE